MSHSHDFVLAEQTHQFVRSQKWEVAVLPFGATEPHNFHMPYGTDNFQVEEIGNRVCEQAFRHGAKVLLLPAIPFGVNTNHLKIPGGLASAVAGLLGLAPDAGTAVGPIGIASETGRVLRAPLVSQLIFVGILSVNLAVLNVLPFPPLDGGRIAVVVVEAIRRRRLPAEREALVYLTGFMVLIFIAVRCIV